MPGHRSRRTAHVSMPPSRGISRSTSATSGARRSASATASCPSAASPTTSTRSLARRRAAVPSRIRRWSSAISTRVGACGSSAIAHMVDQAVLEQSAARCATPGLATRLPPEVAAGLGAISRVARALSAPGPLDELAAHALVEMREALGLSATVLYLPDPGGRPVLRRYLHDLGDGVSDSREELVFDDEAWRLAVASGRPLVFPDIAGWLVGHPVEPAARH